MQHFPRIPNFTELRASKADGTINYEIDTAHPLYNDPLVDLRDFGFADASSYYAKPNSMTGTTLPGVPNAPLVRLDVAKRLVKAEDYLKNDPEVRKVLGTPAHLRIDDALRPYQVQKFAFEIAWPKIIKSTNPDLTDEEVLKEVPNYCARPNENHKPTPHLTGGAVDVALINVETGKPFDRGHTEGAVKGTAYPDSHEGYHLIDGASDIVNSPSQTPVEPEGSMVVLSRRVLYYAMTSVAGLYVNPGEIWHYGKGEPLSEYLSGSNHPYYGVAELPEWYQEAMAQLQSNIQS